MIMIIKKLLNFFRHNHQKFYSLYLLFLLTFFSALTISEIFEDYIREYKIKNVANKVLNIFAIVLPLLTILGILKL